MSDNKLVKTLTDSATLTGLAAGLCWIEKKVIKELMTSDPSSNLMNYVKFTFVMAGLIALEKYLAAIIILRKNNFCLLLREEIRESIMDEIKNQLPE